MASRPLGAPHHPGWTLLLGTVLALTACGGTASSGPSATASTPSAAPTTSSARATPTPTTSVRMSRVSWNFGGDPVEL